MDPLMFLSRWKMLLTFCFNPLVTEFITLGVNRLRECHHKIPYNFISISTQCWVDCALEVASWVSCKRFRRDISVIQTPFSPDFFFFNRKQSMPFQCLGSQHPTAPLTAVEGNSFFIWGSYFWCSCPPPKPCPEGLPVLRGIFWHEKGGYKFDKYLIWTYHSRFEGEPCGSRRWKSHTPLH